MKLKDIKEGEIYRTDYPFYELGDKLGVKAPMRKCIALWNSHDKYIKIQVPAGDPDNAIITMLKAGYIYEQ